MEIIQIVIICLCGAIFISVLDTNKEFGIYISLVISVIVFYFVLNKLKILLVLFNDIKGLIGIEDLYIKILLQILGVTLITEFGSSICKDAARTSLSRNIELAGKIIVLFMALPIIVSIIRLIESLI